MLATCLSKVSMESNKTPRFLTRRLGLIMTLLKESCTDLARSAFFLLAKTINSLFKVLRRSREEISQSLISLRQASNFTSFDGMFCTDDET
jgi:hypothetical protein